MSTVRMLEKSGLARGSLLGIDQKDHGFLGMRMESPWHFNRSKEYEPCCSQRENQERLKIKPLLAVTDLLTPAPNL